jgi:hypothetical protein
MVSLLKENVKLKSFHLSEIKLGTWGDVSGFSIDIWNDRVGYFIGQPITQMSDLKQQALIGKCYEILKPQDSSQNVICGGFTPA